MRAGLLWLPFAVMMVSSGVAAEPAVDAVIAVANAPPAAARAIPLINDPDGEPTHSQTRAGARDDAIFTVVLGGDLGFGGSGQPVIATGALRYGQKLSWAELTAGIAPLFDGDINFANLETVVTDRNDLRANPKSFNFRSHPAGVAHVATLGLNVMSTANNHAIDYGEPGVRETLRHLGAAAAHGLAAWPGIGEGREQASRPADVTVKGVRVRVSAIGIGGGSLPADQTDASRQRAGMLSYNRAEDFNETVGRLADAKGDLRILSVHYGAELQVRAGQSDVAKLRDQAAEAAGIDIVVGHHAHVAAGVQIIDGRLVFYGLGNLLHPGMQDMAKFDVCRDYGLVARAHYTRDATGSLALRAVEAIALTDMHARAKPRAGDAGRARIEVLNHLAAELDDASVGATGVRFMPRADGSGLYCLPGADAAPGRVGELCKGWQAPPPPAREVAQRIRTSCGGSLTAKRRDDANATVTRTRETIRVSRRVLASQPGSTRLTSILGW